MRQRLVGWWCMDLVAALRRAVGDDAVLTEADRQASFVTDWTGRFWGTTPAVVLPSSTDEVVAVLNACRAARAPWVPQGGNTGLVGGGVPVDGEVVVSTRRLRSMGPVDPTSLQITVGAGVTLAELDAHLEPMGLMYGIDFGARDSATIGGTIATNAGGTAVVLYGMTRHQVVGIEAVLPNGDVVSRLGGLAKDNTGYDLAGLLCGSEGTLGIITAARLHVRNRPTERAAAAFSVATIADALLLFGELRATGGLEQCEIMRAVDIAALENARALVGPAVWRTDDPWCILAEVVGPDAMTRLGAAVARVEERVALASAVAPSEAVRRSWWAVREAHPELARHFGDVLKLDVSVPLHALASFVDGLDEAIATAAGPTAAGARADGAPRLVLFGHLGDANLHVNVGGDAALFPAIEDVVLARVLALRGAVSAEHGIGRAKREWLVADRGAAAVGAMWAVKVALDPWGLANPNVVFARSSS